MRSIDTPNIRATSTPPAEATLNGVNRHPSTAKPASASDTPAIRAISPSPAEATLNDINHDPSAAKPARASAPPNIRTTSPSPAEATLKNLLDLDAGRLPQLSVRLNDRNYPLRAPESLPLAHALRLGDLLQTLADTATTPEHFDATAFEIVALVAPQLAADLQNDVSAAPRPPTEPFLHDHREHSGAQTVPSSPPEAPAADGSDCSDDRASAPHNARAISPSAPEAIPNNPGAARRVVVFYAEHLARLAETLAGDGGAPPFSMRGMPRPSAPASPPLSTSTSEPS